MAKRVFIAGHTGMVGSALVRALADDDASELVLRRRAELDLLNQQETYDFFQQQKIDEVYLAAAKVGGILSNNMYPAEFIYENLMIECNVINAAFSAGTTKLLLLGSSCIYPRMAEQPISETALLDGPLELTNEPYAVAKIAGIKLCESYNRQYGVDFRSVMPTNLYGPNDNFHPEHSHVVPGMIGRFHAAKLNNDPEVVVWGTGSPRREFLHVDDMASACVHIMDLAKNVHDDAIDERQSHINIGTGQDCTIAELAGLVSRVVGYQGQIKFDTQRPDGTPRKLLNNSRIERLGWRAQIGLEEGLRHTYEWYLDHVSSLRGVAK